MEIVKDDMKFNNFNDFYDNAKRIKKKYEKLNRIGKYIYKMYLYSNSCINLKVLDKMWEYLNEPFGSCYYLSYEMLGVYYKR